MTQVPVIMPRRSVGLLLCLLALLGLSLTAQAAQAADVTVPFNVGVGPALQLMTGPVQRDQLLHFGLRLELAAVIDQQTIRANRERIPARYRQMASQVEELRYRPSVWIPSTLLISPALRGTGVYGATWRFLGVGMPFGRGPFRLRLGASLIATLALLHSNTLKGFGGEDIAYALFLRPGVELSAEAELRLGRHLLLSFGWSSAIHLPQVLRRNVGKSLFSIPSDAEGLRQSLWHFGQPFLMLHYRFPITRNLPGSAPSPKPRPQAKPKPQSGPKATPARPPPRQPPAQPRPVSPSQPAGRSVLQETPRRPR